MKLVLDAGAFIALERGDERIRTILTRESRAKRISYTHGGVIGQVWRGGARQVQIARVLPALHVVPLDDALGRRAGLLLGRAKKADVIDAALVLLANDEDLILTSDPDDLRPLADAAGLHVDIIEV